MRVLVSGASSGLGRYLAEALFADTFDRTAGHAPQKSYDLIIHCAFNTGKNIPSDLFANYVADNIGLTETLLSIPHGRFAFISSVDVYPKSGAPCREDSVFDTDGIESMYGRMKLICETLVQKKAAHPLILRPTAMLGPYIRRNSLMRVLFEEKPQLTLSAQSSFNYVLHSDIAALICAATERGQEGILNVAANDCVTLAQIAQKYKREAVFGNHTYSSGIIDNTRAIALHPALSRGSLANIDIWINDLTQKHAKNA